MNNDKKTLSHLISNELDAYFKNLDGEQPKALYNLIIEQVERPLLEIVMKQINNNQTQASELLGINRGTLRKKLKQYNLL